MTSRWHILLAAPLLISVGSAAYAEPDESPFYGSVFVDGKIPNTVDSSNFSGDIPTVLEQELDGGFVVGGALGRSWNQLGEATPRTELELSYREGESATGLIGNGAAGGLNLSGDSASTSLVGKIMLDVPLGESVLTPYLGAGVGVRFKNQGFTTGSGVPNSQTGEDYSAQVLAGVSHSLAEQLDVSVDGSYQRSLDDTPGNTANDDDDLGIFSFFVRLRAKF